MTKINQKIYQLLFTLFLISNAHADWVDISPSVEISQTRQAMDRVNRVLFSYVTVTNVSNKALSEPLRLVIVDPNIPVVNASGITQSSEYYFNLNNSLEVNESATVKVSFKLQRVRISFGTQLKTQRTSIPAANAGSDQSVFVGDLVQLDGSASSDMDGDLLHYQWSFIKQPQGSSAQLTGADTINPTFEVDLPGSYEIQLIVNDSESDSIPDTVVLTTQNSKPVADAGPDQSVFVGNIVQLDGINSYDADSDPLTFQWSLLNIPTGSQAELDNSSLINPIFTIDLPGSYHAQLRVSDGIETSNPDTVIITTQNSKPVADAGVDQTAFVGDTVYLNGLGSSDADNDQLTFEWSLISRPDNSLSSIENPTQEQTQFIPDSAGIYVAQLIVRDSNSTSDPDTTRVTVEVQNNSNTRPTANAGEDQTLIVGQTATLDGSSSFDPDQNPITFKWTLIKPEASKAILDNVEAEITTFTADIAGLYSAQLAVNDGFLSSGVDTVNVTVVENSNPAIDSTPITTAITGQSYNYDVNARDADGNALTYSLETFPDGMTIDRNTGLISWLPNATGNFSVVVKVNDGLGGQATQNFTVVTVQGDASNLPPDPVTIAPALKQTEISTFFASTQFLYTGANPIQTGIAEETIDKDKAAVIRGKVLDKQNNPLPGVTITIKDHPEYGQTLTRADGFFDMVVNGGEILCINFNLNSYLPVQRKLNVLSEEYALPPDVILMQLDQQATQISASPLPEMQMVRGSQVQDSDGARQATLLVPKGTQAKMVMPDGQKVAFSRELVVRATEYTVGDNGPLAMPGDLPSTSAYTYAVELSVDEALEKNASRVEFDQPLPFYLENFLNFPVGSVVPMGYYDREKAAWIPSLNGKVISILSEAGNQAILDVDGDGQADTGNALDALGITSDELSQLASLYDPGQSLWRVPITHFTPWDCNWPRVPPNGASQPNTTEPNSDPQRDEQAEDSEDNTACGSIIDCQNQVLNEEIDIVATPYSLNYTSQRAAGRNTESELRIPLSGNTLPPDLKRIELEINILGRQITRSYAPEINLSDTFTWDNRDVYSRLQRGTHFATVRVGYVYDALYAEPGEFEQSFATLSGVPISGNQAREEITLWKESRTAIGGWKAIDDQNNGVQSGIGGWSLNIHHLYDQRRKKILLGDGNEQTVSRWISSTGTLPLSGNIVDTVAGNGINFCANDPSCGDGKLATEADLDPEDVVVDNAGNIYIAHSSRGRIRKVDSDGHISTIAGNGHSDPIGWPRGLALGNDGSLYFSSTERNGEDPRIYKLSADGGISVVAGTGESGFSGDGGLAINAKLTSPRSIAVAPDGSFYFADVANRRVRRVGTDGIITTVAGNGLSHDSESSKTGDGGPATEAIIYPVGISLDSDGNLYISDDIFGGGDSIRRVSPDGIITTIAGRKCHGISTLQGIPALEACFTVGGKVAIDADGNLYFADRHNNEIARISSNGIFTVIAGTGRQGLSKDGTPALQSVFTRPTHVSLGSDGSLYVVDNSSIFVDNKRIRRLGSPLISHVASEDGKEVFEFDADGRHLATRNALTGANLYTFGYTLDGHLATVTDGDNNVTTINRNVDGHPVSISGPYGQTTTLTLDDHHYLASVVNPAGESHRMAYTDDGLITQFTNPRQFSSTYAYGPLGRLIQARNAAGGGLDLEFSEQGNGYQVMRKSALNRRTTYDVNDLPTGTQERTTTFPSGVQTKVSSGADGKYLITLPNGLKKERIETADPRFSIQAPVIQSQTTTNGNLKRTLTQQRNVELNDPSDLFSLVNQTDVFNLNGREITRFYDAQLRTFIHTSAENRQTKTVTDDLGRVTKIEVPGITPTTIDYDQRGRLETISQGDRNMDFSYNAEGYLASLTDPLGRVVNFEYDPAGRVKKQTLPGNRDIFYDYDVNGNLTSLTPPGKPAHQFEYTAIDRQSAYIPPVLTGVGKTDYVYNLDRQIDLVTQPGGAELDYVYDTAGRLDSLSIPRGLYQYQYNANNQLEKMTAPEGELLTYRYNKALLTKVTSTGSIAGSVGFAYDNDFRLSEIKVNNKNPVAYGYDGDNLLTQAGDLSLTYDAVNGLLAETTLENVSDAYDYNNLGELSVYNASYNNTALYNVNYIRDRLGRITHKTETIAGVTTNINYTYNEAGYLATVSKNNRLLRNYTYDSNGNRTHVNGVLLGQYDVQDRLERYGSATFSYRANGELTTKTEGSQNTEYNYDVLGNLINVTLPNGTFIEYIIDGQNRRIGKKINGTLQQGFLYRDQLNPIAELDANGDVKSRFIYARHTNVPDMIIKDGHSYRVITDQLGSPRLIVNIATGEIAQQLDYDEFGNVLLDTNPGFQPFGFAGGIYDLETGLVRFGVRDYFSNVGRWSLKDPLKFGGEDSNFYVYVANDPVNLIDITGLKPCNKGSKDSSDYSQQRNKVEIIKEIVKNGFGVIDFVGVTELIELSAQAVASGLATYGPKIVVPLTKIEFSPWNPLQHIPGLLEEGLFRLIEAAEAMNSANNSNNSTNGNENSECDCP